MANLIKQDAIEVVEATEWLAPLVISKRHNGEVRLCVDLHASNKVVVVDRFPLPTIDSLVNTLHGVRSFRHLI